MNPELYTEEFRNFKYLKLSPEAVDMSKRQRSLLDAVRPAGHEDDLDFCWKTRVEFLDQVFDLAEDSLYIVSPGALIKNKLFDWEEASVIEIQHPRIQSCNPLLMRFTEDDLLSIHDVDIVEATSGVNYYVVSVSYSHDDSIEYSSGNKFPKYVRLRDLSLPFKTYLEYTATFYDKAWAEKYRVAITQHLRKNNDAISAISRLF
jgi:hypothetical protein